MEDTQTKRRGMRSYTVMALLGIFVAAAVLAIVNRMMPGRLSGLARSIKRRDESDDSSMETESD
jgi:hypothetical protein